MRLSLIAILLCTSSCINADEYAAATGGEKNPDVVPIAGYVETLALFDQLGYTAAAWQAGIRVIPRLYLAEIPERWSKTTTNNIDVLTKKQIFFRSLGPLALRSNELILQQRARLKELLAEQGKLADDKRQWLEQLAAEYGLDAAAYPDKNELKEALLPRVDIVPASLVLAQAAEESGWGTSRFAFSGNALFGQWTWGGEGIRPEQQRGGRGDYKIAAFAAPLESVRAHANNLNTHNAYLQFRILRAQLRSNKQKISGNQLAGSLTSYSERGQEYVETLRSIMRYNKLDATDDAYLADAQALVLVPIDTPQ